MRFQFYYSLVGLSNAQNLIAMLLILHYLCIAMLQRDLNMHL